MVRIEAINKEDEGLAKSFEVSLNYQLEKYEEHLIKYLLMKLKQENFEVTK